MVQISLLVKRRITILHCFFQQKAINDFHTKRLSTVVILSVFVLRTRVALYTKLVQKIQIFNNKLK